MSKIKNGLDHSIALNPSNGSNLEQLALRGLTYVRSHQLRRLISVCS